MQAENMQGRCYRVVIEFPCREDNSLTEREMEVVALVSAGLSNGAIAQRLNISYNTVANHLANVRNKTGSKGENRQSMLNTIRGVSNGA